MTHADMDPDAVEDIADRYWKLGYDMNADWEEAEREIARLEGRLVADELTAAFRQTYDERA